ncbi:MAG: enoyl-CoA hydratase/isomerase family protein [Myxococcales bacterium]|nr:enoyl-CoA hydratase/isomerase family protein [Myxococcales bacterium]
MGESKVELIREGAVAQLRFENPPRHTLTSEMVLQMSSQIAELGGDSAVRVVVLRSATPGVFITHYEVGELSGIAEGRRAVDPTQTGDTGGESPRLHPMHELILQLEALDAVTVAAMDGLAMGGGLELALGCDFRVMRDGQHVVALPETGVGIIPGAGGTQRLARMLGTARALDLILHGEMLPPRRALELGILSRVYPAERFDAELSAFVTNLAERAPIALVQAKRAIRQGVELPLREGLALEQAAFGRTMASEDARAAMKAYLKGERYTFKGE